MAAATEWAPPERFEEYTIARPLGRGGMGQVFLGHDTLLDRPVAIKFMLRPMDVMARERFLVEARAAARIQHPNVIAVHALGQVEGRPYIVSELIRGHSLDRLARPLPPDRVLAIGLDLARGLAAAHRRGVLHRDIKAANAILAEDGTVKLCDFGIAKLSDGGGPVAIERALAAPHALTPTPPTVDLRGRDAAAAEDTLPPVDGMATGTPEHDRPPGRGDERDDDTRPPGDDDTRPPGDDDTRPPGDDDTRAPGDDLDGGLDSDPAHPLSHALAATVSADTEPSPSPSPRSPPLTRAGAVMGTPHYLAPELWSGTTATPASDVYSVGALLHELATGALPHAGVPLAALSEVVPTVPARATADHAAGLDPRLAEIIDRCLTIDPAGRFASGAELWNALEDVAAQRAPRTGPGGNPYRGLLPFEAEHADLFFGRSADVRLVLDRLRSEPFVLVTGESGVGKSSLCRAGVLPACGERLGGGRTWTPVIVVPGARPLAALAAALAGPAGLDEEGLAAALADDPGAAVRDLRRALPDDAGLVIMVDQLEELITLASPQAGAAAARVLGELAQRSPAIRLLATVRGDYVTRLAALPGLGAEVGRAFQLLRPLDEDGLRETIVGPARATGVGFASEELIDTLVADAGGLPLLQFTLAELWDRRDRERKTITRTALDQLGGVAGALARHADGVLAGLPPAGRTIARRILVGLVSAHGTRARRTATELVGAAPAADGEATLEGLVRGRLLVARDGEAAVVYEIAHEALLTGWPTLARWLAEASHDRVVRDRIAAAAAEWRRMERGRAGLWSPRQLADTRDLELDELAPDQREFVDASRRAVRRRRWLWASAGVAVVAALVGAYLVLRVAARRDISRQVAAHLRDGGAALGRARADHAQLDADLDAALASFRSGDAATGEERWQAARTAATDLHALLARAGRSAELALGLDASRGAARALLADTLYLRIELADRLHDQLLRDELLDRLTLYDDDGSRRRRWSAPAHVDVTVAPAATLTLARYLPDDDGARRLDDARPLGRVDRTALELDPGSYLLTAAAPGRAEVRYPLAVTRGEQLAVTIDLPPAAAVPDGFVYIPAGRFLFGTRNEALRTFYDTAPLHLRETGAFLIARHETTYGEWLTFLDSLDPAERAARAPKLGLTGLHGTLALDDLGGGAWQLTLQPTTQAYRARNGQAIVYPERTTRARQDWLRMPVTGVIRDDIDAYVAWLDRTGRVPGARTCREDEWERAARGADDREFPHGDRLAPDDANFDRTYGRKSLGFGPDEVGSHPASRSPFGLDDVAGNAIELVVMSDDGATVGGRGGGYYFDRDMAAVANRFTLELNLGDLTLGFRVCATPP